MVRNQDVNRRQFNDLYFYVDPKEDIYDVNSPGSSRPRIRLAGIDLDVNQIENDSPYRRLYFLKTLINSRKEGYGVMMLIDHRDVMDDSFDNPYYLLIGSMKPNNDKKGNYMWPYFYDYTMPAPMFSRMLGYENVAFLDLNRFLCVQFNEKVYLGDAGQYRQVSGVKNFAPRLGGLREQGLKFNRPFSWTPFTPDVAEEVVSVLKNPRKFPEGPEIVVSSTNITYRDSHGFRFLGQLFLDNSIRSYLLPPRFGSNKHKFPTRNY